MPAAEMNHYNITCSWYLSRLSAPEIMNLGYVLVPTCATIWIRLTYDALLAVLFRKIKLLMRSFKPVITPHNYYFELRLDVQDDVELLYKWMTTKRSGRR